MPTLDSMRSCRLAFREGAGGSVLESIESGVLHSNLEHLDTTAAPGAYDHRPGDKIVLAGESVGAIEKQLGMGAMGMQVYLLQRPSGALCAAKVVRSVRALDRRHRRLEVALAREVMVSFALGRSALVASVERLLVPSLSGQKGTTTAKGLTVLVRARRRGDLATAMGSGAGSGADGRAGDYRGPLYTRAGRHKWPLEGITLQLFIALQHVHSRGVMHQDVKPTNIMVCEPDPRATRRATAASS